MKAAWPSHRRETAALNFLEQMLMTLADEPATMARALHAAMNGLVQQWLREDAGFDILQAWETVASRLLEESTPPTL